MKNEALDPRIRRTRQLLRDALDNLLKKRDFGAISVQDIAEAATVNRATFYAHYPDKFALLESVVGDRFRALIEKRSVTFDATCSSALTAVISAVCDYVSEAPGAGSNEPTVTGRRWESAIIAVLRGILLDGLQQHFSAPAAHLRMVATTMSWAIYGAAQDWAQTPNRCSSEEIVGSIVTLLSPILEQMDRDQTHCDDPADIGGDGLTTSASQ